MFRGEIVGSKQGARTTVRRKTQYIALEVAVWTIACGFVSTQLVQALLATDNGSSRAVLIGGIALMVLVLATMVYRAWREYRRPTQPPRMIDADAAERMLVLVLVLVRQGRRIQAVKHHRERTGSSLLEAKLAIDEIAEQAE